MAFSELSRQAMCGRFQLLNNSKTDQLIKQLKVSGTPRYAADIAPGATISIIHGGAERRLEDALWWLLLDGDSLKPNYKYPSFNSRYDKLDKSGSLAYRPWRESRCIIPASAFAEGLGDKKTYHRIELEDRAIAFGGLCRSYLNRTTGEQVYGASIITLPPNDKWRNIHPKSLPLMLDATDESLIDRWLDPGYQEVSAFAPLLQPEIRFTQRITPIDRPSRWNATGGSFLLN